MSEKRTYRTKAKQQHLRRVAALSCIVCRNLKLGETLGEIHHYCSSIWSSVCASNFRIIPLCQIHHRTGGYGVAIHAGRHIWEVTLGTKSGLLAQAIYELGEVVEEWMPKCFAQKWGVAV